MLLLYLLKQLYHLYIHFNYLLIHSYHLFYTAKVKTVY